MKLNERRRRCDVVLGCYAAIEGLMIGQKEDHEKKKKKKEDHVLQDSE